MARNLWRAAVVVWLCWGLALLCSGCADTGPVDCKARPEQAA